VSGSAIARATASARARSFGSEHSVQPRSASSRAVDDARAREGARRRSRARLGTGRGATEGAGARRRIASACGVAASASASTQSHIARGDARPDYFFERISFHHLFIFLRISFHFIISSSFYASRA
jgi:hypothetical protein